MIKGLHGSWEEAKAVQGRMKNWPDDELELELELELVENAKHDVFCETPHIRNKVVTDVCGLFATAGAKPAVGAER
ncbi:MAG: hypothetical protein ABJ251_08845 [Paracoccaceae bacterium]